MLAGALVGFSMADAQTFYKWTDERGVVHFSDAAPADKKGVEERHLPVPREPAAAPVQVESQPPPGVEGTARIVVVSRNAPRTGPSAMHVSGTVKNLGGADARSVAVRVSATDDMQGNPCLSEQTPVEPPTLRPGQTGTFDIEIDSPCLYGQPGLDVTPLWE